MKEKDFQRALKIKELIEKKEKAKVDFEKLQNWLNENHTHTSLDEITIGYSKRDRVMKPITGSNGSFKIVLEKDCMNFNFFIKDPFEMIKRIDVEIEDLKNEFDKLGEKKS